MSDQFFQNVNVLQFFPLKLFNDFLHLGDAFEALVQRISSSWSSFQPLWPSPTHRSFSIQVPDAVLLVGIWQFYPVSCISLESMQSERAQHMVQGSAMIILVCLTFLPVGLHCWDLHMLISHSVTETHSQLNIFNHSWAACPMIFFFFFLPRRPQMA